MPKPAHPTSRRSILLSILASFLAAKSLAASPAAFDLPRIKSNRQRAEIPAISTKKYDVDDLQPHGSAGAKVASSSGVEHLALDPDKDITRTLRGAPNDLVHISFLLVGSDGTTVEIAGAKLSVSTKGPGNNAKVLLGDPPEAGGSPRELGKLMTIERFGGSPMATLPLLTIRIDPLANIWDVYMFDRLVVADIPLAAASGGAGKKFTLHAGSQGALLCGLIIADENPLFADANGNGIDDNFEKQLTGNILPAGASPTTRTSVVEQWKTAQVKSPSKPWTVRRPMPDK